MSHDPPFLEVGTKISGKFKGAFCEAVIKRVDRKIKVSIKRDSPGTGVKIIEDRHIPNVDLVVGRRVDVFVDGERVKGTITMLKDNSVYHVAFTDGDRKSLRRTQLIIMGGRHFDSDGNLDAMPLTNPEHFSAPVMRPADARRSGAGPVASQKTKSKPAESDEEDSEDDRNQPSTSSAPPRRSRKDDDSDDEDEDERSRREKREAKERRKAESASRREQEKRERARSLWSSADKYVPSCRAVKELLRNEEMYKRVRGWLMPQKNERKFRFAVTFTDQRMAERLQELIAEWLADGRDDDGERRGPIDFRSIGHEQSEGMPIYEHFLENEWYPAVILPAVHMENGRRMREIQHMIDDSVERVDHDKMVLFECVPNFSDERMEFITRQRPVEYRKEFKRAYKFVSEYLRKELDHSTLRVMLRFERTVELEKKMKKSPRRSLRDLQTLHSARPTDPDVIEDSSEDTDEESDDESDSSILNASTEAKDRFLATLMQSHDSNNTMLDTNPQIQGHDVDLFYLYSLALRIGAPRKVYTARPWKRWAKKLVPEAVNAEAELEAMFKSCLETYMNISAKLSFPLEQMMVTSERRVVLPGQYSESRRKRETALNPQQPQDTPRPSVSSRGRGGTKSAARGGGRKRKEGSLDSTGERKRARQEDSSRATTSSPGPSEAPSELRDDDDESIAASEASSRKSQKKSSTTPRGQRRGGEDGGVKKGRPRKAPQEVRVARPGGRNADRAMPVDPSDPEYCRANVLSFITKTSKIRASYQDQWFNGNATEVLNDHSRDILNHMLFLQNALHTSGEITAKESVFRDINIMWKQMTARTHYSGWNSRYDEFIPFPKLMVTKKDQYRARRRFRKLPGGENLRPETLAMVEARFCTEKDLVVKPDYLALAREAFATDEYDEEELTNIEEIIERGGRSPAPDVRVRRRQLLDDSDESEDEMEEDVPRRAEEDRESDSEEEEDDDEMDDSSDRNQRQKQREPSDDNSPELGEKSTSPSARNSREVSPESEESSGLQREGGDSRASVEIGERSVTQSRSRSKTPTPRSEDQQADEAPDYEYEAPPREEPEPEEVKESSEESEAQEVDDAEARQALLSDSDADEPRYPSLPKSPVREAVDPSEESESGPMEVEESAAEPIQSPQPSSSHSDPADEAGPSTSGPMFPPNPLQTSGPLTLDSVQPTSGPLEKFDDSPTSSASSASHDHRGRSNTLTTAERPGKRQRRASERSVGDDLVAKRNLLQPQFSSGALTLESISQEPSGPIVPMPMPKGARRNTASPQISNSGPLTASGPLTLAPPSSSSDPVLVANAPLMPPPKAQIGRPRKSPAVLAAPPPPPAQVREEQEDQSSEPGTSTPRALDDAMEDDLAPRPEREPVEQVVTPRGSGYPRGGRRKRGRGGFGAQRTSRTPKRGHQAQQAADYQDDDEERSTPQPTPTHSRGEGFMATKNRMAAEMAADGSSRNYHELGLEDINVMLAQSPMDENLILEEKTAELRDSYHQCKYDFQMWEKRWRRQEAARMRREEEEARKAAAAAARQAESPESDSQPGAGPSTSGFTGTN